MQDLSEAGTEARQQLSQDEGRLQKVVSHTIEVVEAEKRERQSLQDKKAAVETLIRNKHATVVALADKCRDEQLARVGTVCRPLEEEVDTALTARTNVLHHLCQLQQQLQQTLTGDSACTLVNMAKEMREGKGSAQALENRKQAKRSTITRPVLNSTLTLDTVMDNVQAFFGAVDTVEMTLTPAEVKVEEMFTCNKEKDTDVYSLCPLGRPTGYVWVSYAHCGLQKNAAGDLFKESGEHIRRSAKRFGKVSSKCTSDGRNVFVPLTDSEIQTYSKSISLGKSFLKLQNKLHGQADIIRVTVTSTNPWKVESVTEFTINVGPHRAFDADSSQQFFVVVEEAQAPDQPRQVKLYQRNQPDAVATYTPPSKPFNPSDVCFFSLGGEEVLMIADEVGDSVHVVHVQDCRMTVHYASPGCPLLVQPTALNTDLKGRLWVACRGGSILTMTPMTP